MKIVRGLRVLLLLFVAVALVLTAVADDGVSDVPPDDVIVATAGNFELGETVSIIGGVMIFIILMGVLYILNLAIKALSVSVPQEVIHKIGESLVNNMNETMKVLSDKAALTPSPFDDIVVDIGEMTLDAVKQKFLPQLSVEDLKAEIEKRNA